MKKKCESYVFDPEFANSSFLEGCLYCVYFREDDSSPECLCGNNDDGICVNAKKVTVANMPCDTCVHFDIEFGTGYCAAPKKMT